MYDRRIIDLRSDTVTRPCNRMRRAIYNAEVGDNYYGEDSITNNLEKYCSEYFGTESALFVITGTMANQLAIKCHTKPGDEVIIDNYYHILYYESVATSSFAGVSTNILYTENGIITEKHLNLALSNRHRSSFATLPRLICIENTINHYSGKIYPLEEIKRIYNFSRKNNMLIHIDGARLLNASIATQTPIHIYAKFCDSIMISFSKGLGAPAGAVLLGNKEFIERARIYQKWYGGGMHQSGILAAAALFAISNNVEDLSIDHDNAKLCKKLLDNDIRLKVSLVETNIVMFSTKEIGVSALHFTNLLKQKNILVYPWDDNTIRVVTHRDISRKCIIRASSVILEIVSKL